MANKVQRKINNVLKKFNRSLEKDIAPYNQFYVKFFRGSLRDNAYLLHLYRNDKIIATKWFDYLGIVGTGNQKVGYDFYRWLNNEIAKYEVNRYTSIKGE